MRLFFLFLFNCCFFLWGYGQDSYFATIKKFQQELDEHYQNKDTSPLSEKERRKFKGHRYFQIDSAYRIVANFERIPHPDTIVMPTSAGTEKVYLRYANIRFSIQGVACKLVAYQSLNSLNATDDQKQLFIPFTDETSGKKTYGGGRYLDILIPKGDTIIIDFNRAYNPYCAYTTGWFCPLPPKENSLNVSIKAGLMTPSEH
ncbi:MAG: DUF1684 domain-containing protein [Crocinitomicaceae bacterium]